MVTDAASGAAVAGGLKWVGAGAGAGAAFEKEVMGLADAEREVMGLAEDAFEKEVMAPTCTEVSWSKTMPSKTP